MQRGGEGRWPSSPDAFFGSQAGVGGSAWPPEPLWDIWESIGMGTCRHRGPRELRCYTEAGEGGPRNGRPDPVWEGQV